MHYWTIGAGEIAGEGGKERERKREREGGGDEVGMKSGTGFGGRRKRGEKGSGSLR